MQKELILKNFEDLKKAVMLLESSIKRFVPFDCERAYTSCELEFYDSLSFRFEKSVEVILNFFRSLEIFLYSKSSDTLRDRLLVIQKLNLIDDIEFWMEARLLRNKISHAYLPDQLKDIYEEILDKSTTVSGCLDKIEKYFKENEIIEE